MAFLKFLMLSPMPFPTSGSLFAPKRKKNDWTKSSGNPTLPINQTYSKGVADSGAEFPPDCHKLGTEAPSVMAQGVRQECR